MTGFVIPMQLLQSAAGRAPAGYLQDCLAEGTVSEDGSAVVFAPDRLMRLMQKYGSLTSPVPMPQDQSSPSTNAPPAGAGTELKKLLSRIGITAKPNCSCNARARTMDEKGVQWCEDNVDTIVGWLREEATKRKLPFVDMAGRAIVNLAIRRARKLEACNKEEPDA